MTCVDAGGVRAFWSSIVVQGRVVFEDVHDSAERCLTETGLLTSDRAGCSPARVAGRTAVKV
jgi:hypothetical protein